MKKKYCFNRERVQKTMQKIRRLGKSCETVESCILTLQNLTTASLIDSNNEQKIW